MSTSKRKPDRSSARKAGPPTSRKATHAPKVLDDGQLTKRPDRARWVETLDRLANRPILEGDYLPGPIAGTDAKNRSPKHPKP